MSAVASPHEALQQPGTRRLPSWAPEASFVALLALGVVLVLVETRGLSFFGDEWDFVLDRRGMSAGVLLQPHGPHLVLVPILVYKVLLQLFGAGSYLPFRLLAAFDLVLVALVVGIVCRDRWGRWWGLAPVLLLVTLGPGGVTLLWPFQVGYAVAIAAGLAALIALDRNGRRTDLVCCVALIVSLASGSQGIAFLVGAAVMLAFRPNWRRRSWVVVVPAILYLLWYARYGHQYSETHLSLWNTSLSYSMQALSATLAGTFGLSSVSPQTGLLDITFGVPLAIAAVAAVAIASWRGWRARALFWGTAATLVVAWVAASVSNYGAFSRPPNDPRYLSSNVALLLICVCLALPRPRLARTGVIVAVLVLTVIAATNADQYRQARTSLLASDVASRAELGALLLVRGIVPPQFSPAVPGDPAVLVNVQAGPFFSAVDSFGVDADSPAALLAQDETTRERADGVLERGELQLSPAAGGERISSAPPTALSGTHRVAGGCLIVGGGPLGIRTPAGRYELAAAKSGSVTVEMGRFASTYDAQLGTVPAHSVAIVSVPADRAPQIPWRMLLTGPGGRVCRVGT
ncbi:MAG: hypothetical protein WAK93_13630 [Solirubrobacteraceae bacterium]